MVHSTDTFLGCILVGSLHKIIQYGSKNCICSFFIPLLWCFIKNFKTLESGLLYCNLILLYDEGLSWCSLNWGSDYSCHNSVEMYVSLYNQPYQIYRERGLRRQVQYQYKSVLCIPRHGDGERASGWVAAYILNLVKQTNVTQSLSQRYCNKVNPVSREIWSQSTLTRPNYPNSLQR